MRRVLLLGGSALIGVFVLVTTLAPRAAHAQDDVPAREEIHFGAGSCAAQACHGGAMPERAEYKTWATRDRHSRAYEVLDGPLGRRIGARLGLTPTQSARCLNCHGTTGVKTAPTFDPADGVSCELCHGGARDWLGPHVAPDWRRKTPAQKEKLGLRDLTTPGKRAAMCAECHVAGAGRDISHAIMAAGHPPLVFDAAKFMRDMPAHWTDEADTTLETWVEGQRANALAQLGHVARAAEAANGAPDWTIFDCYGCHHPIYTDSVYERREPAGRPGDPALDLASLHLFATAASDPAFLNGLHDLLHDPLAEGTWDMRILAKRADEVAEALRGFKAELDADAVAGRLDAHLRRLEDGEAFTPRAGMQQIAFAVLAVAPAAEHGEAFAALDAALAPGRPYDVAACAKLARVVLAARR